MTVNSRVQDEDMAYPEDWKTNSTPQSTGHKPQGRTIALHSLAVSPNRQKTGLGKGLMKAYIDEMRRTGNADRIAILTYDRLVPYYEKLGFTHYGKSESEYAGVAWHDLVSFDACVRENKSNIFLGIRIQMIKLNYLTHRHLWVSYIIATKRRHIPRGYPRMHL